MLVFLAGLGAIPPQIPQAVPLPTDEANARIMRRRHRLGRQAQLIARAHPPLNEDVRRSAPVPAPARPPSRSVPEWTSPSAAVGSILFFDSLIL